MQPQRQKPSPLIYRDVAALAPVIEDFRVRLSASSAERLRGICGFDGFIDTFLRMEVPPSMGEFGPKVTAAAGVAASYRVRHLGEKFGGNGPLLAAALADICGGSTEITYIGAIGDGEVLPIFRDALEAKTKKLHALGAPAVTTCLEFTDGKIMLNDAQPCAAISWERLLERVGADSLDKELQSARFIAAVNWGKLPHAGPIWSGLARRLSEIGSPAKSVVFFMDLAEFETRSRADLADLAGRIEEITRQCDTILSLNLKEAWQMAGFFGGAYHGRRDPETVADLALFLRQRVAVDRVIVHPREGSACASAEGTIYVAGPYCASPLISTGAGDNFGAGCLAGILKGLDDRGVLLAGNGASGHFVRSGRTPSFNAIVKLLDAWSEGTLGDRLP